MLVKMDGVTKAFNKIDGVSDIKFGIAAGEFVGLLGLNGSGKTTTLKLLSGFLQADRGDVIIDNHSPRKSRQVISYLGDRQTFYPWMAPSDIGKFMSSLFRAFKPEKFTQLRHALEIPPKAISQMSKGQSQRLRLAASLAIDAKLYLLDEPLSGIDLVSREMIIKTIEELKQSQASVLLSTHEIKEVEGFFDRALYLKEGTLVADVTPKDFSATKPSFLSFFLDVNKEGIVT